MNGSQRNAFFVNCSFYILGKIANNIDCVDNVRILPQEDIVK